jgi:hypothetical protein
MSSKLEDLLNSLETLAGQHPHEPEAVTTIETAAKALLFLQHIGRLNDFWDYARIFGTEEAWPKPVRSFANRDEALDWVRTQPALPYETVIGIADALYNIGRLPDGEWVFIRFPSLEELEDGEE